jgi:hypothetical protein
MNAAQRELLSKGLADVAKGVFVAAPIAMGTSKLSLTFTLVAMLSAVVVFVIAYVLAGGGDHERP